MSIDDCGRANRCPTLFSLCSDFGPLLKPLFCFNIEFVIICVLLWYNINEVENTTYIGHIFAIGICTRTKGYILCELNKLKNPHHSSFSDFYPAHNTVQGTWLDFNHSRGVGLMIYYTDIASLKTDTLDCMELSPHQTNAEFITCMLVKASWFIKQKLFYFFLCFLFHLFFPFHSLLTLVSRKKTFRLSRC